MNKLFAAIIVVSLCGCGASLVTTRGFNKGEYAPTNEAQMRGGTVQYLAQGWDSAIRKRRESAYKRMHKVCGGPYKITREVIGTDSGAAVNTYNSSYYAASKSVFIDFLCEDHANSQPSANAN